MDEISYPYTKKPRKPTFLKKPALWLFLFLIIAGLAYGSFLAYKIYYIGKKINIENTSPPSFLQTAKSLTSASSFDLKGYEDGRINILLLGIGGKGHPGQNLTDTIMLASLNTETNQVALYSIPRDMYVKIPDENYSAKINTLYQIGLGGAKNDSVSGANLIVKTVEELIAQKINYCAVLNFGGFEKIIDTIGGINIMNERDMNDPGYPGPGYSYAPFKLEKGFHHLDGATALKYARERHNDPEGDFGRAKRQQQVIQAAKNKVFSAGTFLNPIAVNNLLDALGNNIITNAAPAEIVSFLELARRMDTQNINNVVLDAWNKDSLLKIVRINNFSALVPRIGNLSEIQELAENIFDLNVLKRRRAEIEKEDANIIIINASGDYKVLNAVKKLLSVNLNYKNVAIANAGKFISDKTTVYDLENGAKPFTLDELAAKLPAAVSCLIGADIQKLISPPAGGKNTDMVLVIGKDLEERYNMDEATIEDLNNERDDEESLPK